MSMEKIIVWSAVMCILMGIFGLSPIYPYDERIDIVDCFDDKHNLIIGLECEDVIIEYTFTDPMSVIVIFFVAILIGQFVIYWRFGT